MRHRLLVSAILVLVSAFTAKAESIRIAVVSDLNGTYGSTEYSDDVDRAVEAIIALRPDVVLSTGDMVAGQRQPPLSDAAVRAMWDAFHTAVSDPLKRAGIPFAVTPGNHDGSAYPGFEAERSIFADEWKARRPTLSFTGPDSFPFFYAFDLGPARIVSLDATRIGHLDKEQMAALETVFDGARPARIVFSHLPLWPFTNGRQTEIIGDPALEALLDRIGVDLYLSGHHHAFYPGQIDAFSVVSQAELGGGARSLIGTDRRGPKSITMLDIAPDGGIRISALRAPDFRTPIDFQTLPERLETPNRTINRIDMVPSGSVEVTR